MKKFIGRFVVAAAMALAVSGVAQAKDNDDDGKPCSDATLDGLYVFTASGFNIVSGVPQPKAIVELIIFNGDGTITGGKATVSINGAIMQNPGGSGPTYTLDADCTGTLNFGPMKPKFNLYVAFKGSQIQMIQMDPLTVLQGTAERVSEPPPAERSDGAHSSGMPALRRPAK